MLATKFQENPLQSLQNLEVQSFLGNNTKFSWINYWLILAEKKMDKKERVGEQQRNYDTIDILISDLIAPKAVMTWILRVIFEI